MVIDCFKPILTDPQKAKLFQLLRVTDKAMGSSPWMLYGGSLLGYVLWEDLVPWDDDIDVVTNTLPPALNVAPFHWLRMDYGINPLVKVFDPQDPKVPLADHTFPFIDVSMMHTSGSFVVHPSTHGGIDRFPREIVFPLRRVKFGPGTAMVPNDPVKLLKLKYGADCFASARTPYWDHQREQFTSYPNARVPLADIVNHFGYPPFRQIT